MASKLLVVAALFVCFLVLTEASFRITTMVDEEENPQQRLQSQQCQQQVQRQRIRSCQDYVAIQQQRGSGRRYSNDDLEMNPQIRGQQESIEQCCEEMQQIDRECRCQALQEIARQVQQEQQQQQQQGGRWREQEQGSRWSRGGQQQRIQQQVRQIPQMCRIQVPQQCQQGY